MTNPHEVVLAGGATLRFATTRSAVERPAASLPSFQVSGLPGARIALRRAYADEAGLAVHVACVEAPSDRWAPGIEDVVLGVANGVAHRAMSERLTIEQWDVGAAVFQDQRFEQQLNGRAVRESSPVKLWGKHVLGFEGETRDVVLCSVLCDEPRDRDECTQLVATASLTGLVAAPPPSLLVRSVLFAAEKPMEASALVGVFGALVVGVILSKRPRPKR
jgi:hypothetical protein